MSVTKATEARLRRRHEAAKRYRERWYNDTGIKVFHQVQRNRPREAEAARLMAERPEDTRTPAQVLMGEPLPGRSALDRRRESQNRVPIFLASSQKRTD